MSKYEQPCPKCNAPFEDVSIEPPPIDIKGFNTSSRGVASDYIYYKCKKCGQEFHYDFVTD